MTASPIPAPARAEQGVTMNSPPRNLQHGKAMTAFVIVTMSVLLPLFFGVLYLGKLSDLKHGAIQASRFAAFQRAMGNADERNDLIYEETRARFFVDPQQLNNGQIRYQDRTGGRTPRDT